MPERIEGRVASLLNDRRLVINCGEEVGVGIGMRFAILSERGVEIHDPDSGKKLGELEVAKTVVKVVTVFSEYSIAKAFRTAQTYGIGSVFESRKITEKLITDDIFEKQEFEKSERKIAIGDRVVEVVGDEFDGLTLDF